jgi:hypothetical protein
MFNWIINLLKLKKKNLFLFKEMIKEEKFDKEEDDLFLRHRKNETER